jgi:ApaG protein
MTTVVPTRYGSDTTTRGFRVTVEPHYESAHSDPDDDRYVFSYRIRISNQSDAPATLIGRHWIIVDADGERHEVEGEGVVGRQPRLEPGAVHEYSSFCPLRTSWGTMEGSYDMRDDAGEEFRIVVGRFYLAAR